MEFIDLTLAFAGGAVMFYGAGFVINGASTYGEGKSQHNAGKQNEGMAGIIGGIIVICVGLFLVPELKNFLPGLTWNS